MTAVMVVAVVVMLVVVVVVCMSSPSSARPAELLQRPPTRIEGFLQGGSRIVACINTLRRAADMARSTSMWRRRLCLADESSPAFLVGGMAVASSVHKDEDTLTARFRTGEGVGWHEHHHDLFVGTERFFRPAYVSQLVTSWVPALDGVVAKLEAGGRVADIGCGHGASTIELAKAFPQATITGFDYHEASIVAARQRAAEAGMADRVRFEVAAGDEFGPDTTDTFGGVGYDLVCIFDALHDMGDPVGVARHIRSQLAPDGTWLVVEPRAADRLEDNLHLLGRIFYSASTLICTPASRAQPVGACLGAQAGPARLRAVMEAAGFTRFREVVDSPTNLVLEVRP